MFDKLETELKIRGFSQKTVDSYKLYNEQFLKFINKEPEKIEENDIKNYLNYLTSNKHYKPRSLNLALSSLKFFYNNVMNKKITENIKSPKLDKKVPVILNNEEIRLLLNAITNQKHKILISLMLSSGLRISEAVSVKISDINFEEKTLKVKHGKENKERTTIVSGKLLEDIKIYLAKRKDSNPYLFSIRDSHVTIKLPQKIIKGAAKKANLNKKIHCHALRSTFANNLMSNGVSNRYIKTLLGHNNSGSEIYAKASLEEIKKIKNPLDNL